MSKLVFLQKYPKENDLSGISEKVKTFFAEGHRVKALKQLRKDHSLGLKDAKNILARLQ